MEQKVRAEESVCDRVSWQGRLSPQVTEFHEQVTVLKLQEYIEAYSIEITVRFSSTHLQP